MEPIELELISIHNMQEAKTNRDGLELKLHGRCIRRPHQPLFCSDTGQGTDPAPLVMCLSGAVLTPQTLLQTGQEHHNWEHTALCTLRSFLVTKPRDWKMPRCTPSPGAAWQCRCVMHPEGKRLGEILCVLLTPSSSPPGSCLVT